MKTKIAMIALAMLALTGCGVNEKPGTNEKIGVIVKVGKTGILCDTWEAQIVRGGLIDGSGVMGAPFNFTVEYPGQVDKLKEYMNAGTEVKITYRTEGIYASWRSDSGGDFLISVEPIRK